MTSARKGVMMAEVNISYEELKELYIDKRLSVESIAEHFNTTEPTVARRLKAYELHREIQGKKSLPYEEAEKLYIQQKWSINALAKHYGMSEPTAKKELVRLGLYERRYPQKSKKRKCKKCVYRGKLGQQTTCCEYILVEGHSRGCPVDDCTCFKKGEPAKRTDSGSRQACM